MTTMLKMRLQNIGRRHDPHARLVVTDASRGPKSGKYIEVVGVYNKKSGFVKIDSARVNYWLGVGVEPSVTVHNMLVAEGVITKPKINALPKKTAPQKEPKSEEAVSANDKPVAETKTAEETGESEQTGDGDSSDTGTEGE